MSSYQAPVNDFTFALNELVDLPGINQLEPFGEATPDMVQAVIEEAGKFASEVLSPINHSGDQQGSQLQAEGVKTPDGWKEAYRAFTENGWNSIAFDPEFGGQGLPWVLATVTQEIWASANLSFSLCPLLTQGAIEAISNHAADPLKSQYLEKLVSGEWTGTMNLTEPQAGSDLSAVRTRAVPEGDHYLISGQKIFITYGDHDLASNIVHLVLARTPDAPEGVRGISLFVVPQHLIDDAGEPAESNDVHCVSLEHKLGINASPTAVMSFGENGGAIGYLVGEENKGLHHMFTMMNIARLGVGVEGVAIAEMAYQKARDYALDRIQGRAVGPDSGDRVAIVQHPDIKRMLMDMRAQIEAMRALSLLAAACYDKSRYHPQQQVRSEQFKLLEFLTPVVKGWCTETANTIASLGLQIHGGVGFIEETGAAQYFRDARITTIYEGTSGIQAGDLIGRKLGRDGGQVARALMEEMRRDLDAAAYLETDFKARLDSAVTELAESTQWILERFEHDPQSVSVAAFAYMMLWGVVAGGWLMAKSRNRAAEMIENGEGNSEFLRAKITSAGFYIKHVLPRSTAWAKSVTDGSDFDLLLAAEQY